LVLPNPEMVVPLSVALIREVWETFAGDPEAVRAFGGVSLRNPDHLKAFLRWSAAAKFDVGEIDLGGVYREMVHSGWLTQVLPMIDLGSERVPPGVLCAALGERDVASVAGLMREGARTLGGAEDWDAVLSSLFGGSGKWFDSLGEALMAAGPPVAEGSVVERVWEVGTKAAQKLRHEEEWAFAGYESPTRPHGRKAGPWQKMGGRRAATAWSGWLPGVSCPRGLWSCWVSGREFGVENPWNPRRVRIGCLFPCSRRSHWG
jgi:hypothetical protein